MPKPYIHTVNGIAYFEKTIKEDKYGNWNDSSYPTIRGYLLFTKEINIIYIKSKINLLMK